MESEKWKLKFSAINKCFYVHFVFVYLIIGKKLCNNYLSNQFGIKITLFLAFIYW